MHVVQSLSLSLYIYIYIYIYMFLGTGYPKLYEEGYWFAECNKEDFVLVGNDFIYPIISDYKNWSIIPVWLLLIDHLKAALYSWDM